MEREDFGLQCSDCGVEFIFTAGEQMFYESKGLSRPKRCSECRKRRKASIIPAKESNGTGR